MDLLEAQRDDELITLEVSDTRSCTRCEGTQHLVAHFEGMGKYVCDTCNMSVGFDLEADVSDFLIDRGLPFHYTKDIFGSRLMPVELEPRTDS